MSLWIVLPGLFGILGALGGIGAALIRLGKLLEKMDQLQASDRNLESQYDALADRFARHLAQHWEARAAGHR